jgi:hypothetical protein
MRSIHYILIILLIVVIGSCIQVKDPPQVIVPVSESKKICYATEIEGCEYIYCQWYAYPYPLSITPKLNQSNPEKCNLNGKIKY